uniref:DNA-directed DNA polymerase n=1 Tax=Tanacetum cinerariifolium TaxID=118510 RepID=A0A6L2MF78_TANCI|nr:DNA-directed DNA polymerase [Tanacetum cinerariifolium]
MQTRSSSRLVSNPSSNPTPSTNPNPKGRNRRRSKQRIEEFNLDELSPPIVMMVDQCTMDQLLQAPTEGYEDAIVVPTITADNFELKHGLLTLVQNKQFFGHDKEDPHAHIRYFNKITSTLKFPNVPNTEAWDRFKDLLRACPHHGFSELHQLDTFYNAFNSKDQDSLNSAAGVSTNTSTSGISPDVAELKDMVKALLIDKKSQNQAPATVKTVEESCVTCGGAHSYRNCPATVGNVYRENIQEFVSQAFAVNYNQGNTSYRPPMISNQIRPRGFPPVMENEPEVTKDTIAPTNNRSTKDVQPPVVQTETLVIQISKPVSEPVISLSEVARTPLDEHCSVVLLKKFPKKLGDPGKFLIPCDFPRMDECLALADLAASINLMPLSMWKRLSLPELTPTSDFVVVDFDADPQVPLILRRSFLKTGRALIDVFEDELTLCVGKEAITFNPDQTLRYSANYNNNLRNRIDVIEMACEEYSQEVLDFLIDFLLEEVDAFLVLEDDPTSLEVDQSYFDSEGDILLLEAFLNNDPSPSPQGNYLPQACKELKICEAKSDKSLINEPPEVELIDLPPYLEYSFLEGDNKFPVIIAKDLSVDEKTALITVLKSHKRAIAWKLFDIKGTFQRCMMAIFHDMIEITMEVFMDDFSVFGNSFQSCLFYLERMLKRCEDTNLCLNWKKSHFMVKEGIVLGYKISKQGIEVDKAKVDVITKLPHPTTVKECVEAFQTFKRKLTEAPILIAPDWDMPFELMCDASDFAIGAVLRQHQDKHFRPIHYASKTMTEAKSNYTTTEKEMLAVVYAFEKFQYYLIMNKSIVYTDHSALKYPFAKKDSKARLLY